MPLCKQMVLATKFFPWNYRAWHAGGSANNSHIGIEMTESDCVKYITGSNFVCSNFVKDREMDMPELHSEGLI